MPLYVSVTPGITVDSNTNVDATTLNLIGTPTVDITGTVDGDSSVTISAGSVTSAMMANMLAHSVKGNTDPSSSMAPTDIVSDQSTIDVTGSVLKVKSGGITSTQLASIATAASGAIADTNVPYGTLGRGKLQTQTALTLLGNGGATSAVPPEPITIGGGLTVTAAAELATASRARSSNVATIVMGAAHSFATGDVVNVTGLGGTGYTAYGVSITVTTSTAFTYTSAGSDESTATDTSGKVRRVLNAGTPTSSIAVSSSSAASCKAWCNFNGGVAPTNGGAWISANSTWVRSNSPTTGTVTVTLPASAPTHDIAVGMQVYFSFNTGGTGVTGMKTITAVNTSGSPHTYSFVDTNSVTASGTGLTHCAIRSSSNVSSIECFPANVGWYHVTFTSALADANYAVVGSASYYTGQPNNGHFQYPSYDTSPGDVATTTSFWISTTSIVGASDSAIPCQTVAFHVFGN